MLRVHDVKISHTYRQLFGGSDGNYCCKNIIDDDILPAWNVLSRRLCWHLLPESCTRAPSLQRGSGAQNLTNTIGMAIVHTCTIGFGFWDSVLVLRVHLIASLPHCDRIPRRCSDPVPCIRFEVQLGNIMYMPHANFDRGEPISTRRPRWAFICQLH